MSADAVELVGGPWCGERVAVLPGTPVFRVVRLRNPLHIGMSPPVEDSVAYDEGHYLPDPDRPGVWRWAGWL